MDEGDVLAAGLKATLDSLIERLGDLLRSVRNTAKAPKIQKRLERALSELLLISPNVQDVEEAIREAEKYGFDGDALRRTKERLGRVQKGTRKAAKRKPRPKYKRGGTSLRTRKRKPGVTQRTHKRKPGVTTHKKRLPQRSSSTGKRLHKKGTSRGSSSRSSSSGRSAGLGRRGR